MSVLFVVSFGNLYLLLEMSEWSDPQGTHVESCVIHISEAFLAVDGAETVVGSRKVGGK